MSSIASKDILKLAKKAQEFTKELHDEIIALQNYLAIINFEEIKEVKNRVAKICEKNRDVELKLNSIVPPKHLKEFSTSRLIPNAAFELGNQAKLTDQDAKLTDQKDESSQKAKNEFRDEIIKEIKAIKDIN